MRTVTWWLFSLFVTLTFAGCGGGGGGGGSAGTGTLSVSLSDATLPAFQAIYVTVDEVEVHPDSGGGWQSVADPAKTVNLLELINGVREELGVTTLNAGHYTQMRLILGATPDSGLNLFSQPHPFANYFIDESGAIEELKVPSGQQTGIKLINGFDINANQTTELILDFDAMKSVVMAGSSEQWLLKPTIKALDTATYAVVTGTVTYNSAQLLEGVSVSAQVYNAATPDAKDEVAVQAATLSDANGNFALFVEPGGYNLVAFLAGAVEAFGPGCTTVTALHNSTSVRDFDLALTEQIGEIAGAVTINAPLTDQHATLSIRQGASCNGGTDQIELTALNVAEGGSYAVNLPAATYNVVGWTFDHDTLAVENIVVTDGGSEAADFAFGFPP